MKKVLFIIPGFNMGGTNKSLMNILAFIKGKGFDAEIFAMSRSGPYKELLAGQRLLKRDRWIASVLDSFSTIKTETLPERILSIFIKIVFRIWLKATGEKMPGFILKRAAKKLDANGYDTVVAMQEGYATHLASFMKGRKVAWIRCDYGEYYKIAKTDEKTYYEKFDHVICVSTYTKQVFVSFYPQLEGKCHGIHNMIDHAGIKKKSCEKVEDERFATGGFTIVSVGRLSKVKQFELIPGIAKQLLDDGCAFTWYIIGDGREREAIEREVKENGVTATVILLGEKKNPYPYIRNADLMVVTSLSEACPNVINEAKILNVPVVTTDFGSASEFIENGFNGMIADKRQIKPVIEKLIKNKEHYGELKANISGFEYSNDAIIDSIMKLL